MPAWTPKVQGYEFIKQAYRHLVDKVESYQLESGLYSWQLMAKEGPVDTSATAMILYAIALSLETGILIDIHRSRMLRGRDALRNSVKDGKLGNCLAECLGFSMYPPELWGLSLVAWSGAFTVCSDGRVRKTVSNGMAWHSQQEFMSVYD